MIATPGGQSALYAAVQGVLDPGDHAIVVAPYYATYPGTFRAAGAGLHRRRGARPRTASSRAPRRSKRRCRPNTRAILHQHAEQPDRRGLFARQRSKASPISACRHDLWLLSDEVYWTLGGGEHVSPRALPGMAERTLVINSMSKSHGMTGWRIGWLTGPEELITLLISLNLVTTYGLNDFVSRAAVEALENDYGVERDRRRAMRRAARSSSTRCAGSNDITVRGSEGGMYVMLDIRAVEPDCEKFAWALARRREGRPSCRARASATRPAGHIRISLASPTTCSRKRRAGCAASPRPIGARPHEHASRQRPAPSSSAAASPAARSPITWPSSAGRDIVLLERKQLTSRHDLARGRA